MLVSWLVPSALGASIEGQIGTTRAVKAPADWSMSFGLARGGGSSGLIPGLYLCPCNHSTWLQLILHQQQRANYFFARVGALCVPRGTSHRVEFVRGV